jgi:hypothetical protein
MQMFCATHVFKSRKSLKHGGHANVLRNTRLQIQKITDTCTQQKKQGGFTIFSSVIADALARTMIIVIGCAVFGSILPDPSTDLGKRRLHFYLLKAWAGETDSAGRIILQVWTALSACRLLYIAAPPPSLYLSFSISLSLSLCHRCPLQTGMPQHSSVHHSPGGSPCYQGVCWTG